jgi:hypothetical protein
MKEKCTSCGKETVLQNQEGKCYDCMNEVDQKMALLQLQKLEEAIRGKSGNGKVLTKEEFLEEAEEEDRILKVIGKMRKELNEDSLQEASEKGLNVDMKGAAGSVSLRKEDVERENSEYSEGFDSPQDMIEWAKKNDKEAYNKLFIHTLRVLKDKPNCEIPELPCENPEKSIIGNFLERKNKELRHGLTIVKGES